MTAVVGILNKQGIAVAADSAVTVSNPNNRKIYNSANKIFTLSKYHPVGVTIYNNASFLGIPWEVLIKEYRKQLGEKSFPKLNDYKQDFFRWLRKNNFFSNEADIDNFLFHDYISFLQALISDIEKEGFEETFLTLLDKYINEEIPKHRTVEGLSDMEKVKVKDHVTKLTPKLIEILKEHFTFDEQKISQPLIEAYSEFLLHDQFLQFSGLVFVGYGEVEIFPGLIPVNVSIIVGDQLRYNTEDSKSAFINNQNSACIRPFAQTDVIDTILQGISPELSKMTSKVFGDFLQSFLKEIKSIDSIPQPVIHRLDNLNVQKYIQDYNNKLDNIISEKYVGPLMDAVSQLSKEDLAEMAESLVYLTYLKRRFTMAEESVGGPVDIAVITKGDCFIWIKRKHYFDPNLNQNFFQKYFKP